MQNVKHVHRWSTHIWPLQIKNAKINLSEYFFFLCTAPLVSFFQSHLLWYSTFINSDKKDREIKSSCWHQDPEMLLFLLRSYMKNIHTLIWSSAPAFWPLRNKYPQLCTSYRLNLLREVPNSRYWCKVRVSCKWPSQVFHWEYIQQTSRPTARAAPAPTLSRMGLQYSQLSRFLSESVSLCFICWSFCAVLAILSSRCRFLTLKLKKF